MPDVETMESEARAYNALAIQFESGYGRLQKLFERCGSWQTLWQSEGDETNVRPEKAWEELVRHDVSLILRNDPRYPNLLREISSPPHGLYVRGTLPPDDQIKVAIVGTRKATASGRECAGTFAEKLSRCGIGIVSGIALGIDAAAHAGCLAAHGKTLAVLANGVEKPYPETNAQLAEKIIAQGGAIISEYPLGSPAIPYRFLDRNRIVSGLAQGTLVIEAPRESGSLATARFTFEQNRSLFVVPGPRTHPNFRGSHDLIRAGAELVTEPEEILESLGIEMKAKTAQLAQKLSPEAALIMHAVEHADTPLTVDKIALVTELEVRTVSQTLTLLVLRNVIKETGEGYSI